MSNAANFVQKRVVSATQTANGSSLGFDCDLYDVLAGLVTVTAFSGTTPTALFYIQTSYDGGTVWFDVAVGEATFTGTGKKVIGLALPNAPASAAQTSFAATDGSAGTGLAAATAPKAVPLGSQYRFAWTITGTTPSFTFTIDSVIKQD